jgi:holo-[acyl-carrier protein] synthase
MKLTSGIDLIDIARVQQAVDRHGRRFLERVFTPLELAECSGRIDSLAGRFAAKEAVAKALGVGIGQVGWKEIEVQRGPTNAPTLHLYGTAAVLAAELGLQTWSISLSHTQTHAIAMAVLAAT